MSLGPCCERVMRFLEGVKLEIRPYCSSQDPIHTSFNRVLNKAQKIIVDLTGLVIDVIRKIFKVTLKMA